MSTTRAPAWLRSPWAALALALLALALVAVLVVLLAPGAAPADGSGAPWGQMRIGR